MKRIGLMGYGHVADYGHLPAIQSIPDLELVAVYDPDPDRLRLVGERYGIERQFTDSDAFFQAGMDAVAVTSSAPAHKQNVLDAARHGKHVLCEKPLAMTDEDAEEMIRVMDSAGLMLFSGFCYRFSPVSLRIKDLVARRAIGEVRSLRLIYIWNLHGKYEYNEHSRIESPRRIGRMLEGGPMVDCGVHQIDLARWWLGSEVARYHAAGAWVENYEAPDHMWLHLDHECGAHTCVEMSFSYSHTAHEPISHFSYHLIGTHGLIRYDRDGWHFEMRTGCGSEYFSGADEKNFAGMYEAFSRALETGEAGNLATGRDGLIAVQISRTATEQVIADRAAALLDTIKPAR